MLYSFGSVPEGNAGKETPESFRLEFSEKISAKNFALSDAEDINLGSLYKGAIAFGKR